MQLVTIPCHPISRRMVIAEHGAEPVQVAKTSALFGVLAGYAVGQPTTRNMALFTDKLTFLLPDNLAAHLAAFPMAAAERMYVTHKDRLAWYTFAFARAKGKGAARAGVGDCLDLFNVDEDEYSVATGYKLFQRAGWEIEKKNRRFCVRLKTKSAAFPHAKSGRRANFYLLPTPLTWKANDMTTELAISRFLSAYNHRFQSTPVALPNHVRIYAYNRMQNLSHRAIAAKFKITRSTVERAILSIRARSERNAAFQHLLEEMFALPQALPTPTP